MSKNKRPEEEKWVDIINDWHKHETYQPIRPLDKKIVDAINTTQKGTIEAVESLIAEEMLVANKEKQPTSRLTSLVLKVHDLK